MTSKYEIEIIGRGEEMLYTDGDIELLLDRTYCDGHRLFCDSTIGVRGGPVLPFRKRRQIIENLCDYFDTKNKPSTDFQKSLTCLDLQRAASICPLEWLGHRPVEVINERQNAFT